MSKKLNWGQTPWDNMSREDLLREVQRMFSAVQSARSAIGMARGPEPHSPYWLSGGTGGRALAKCDQVIKPVTDDFDFESLYGAFYRYADDLLFSGEGHDWAVCPKCGSMMGSSGEGDPAIGKPCPHDGETMRALGWADLAPARADG